MPNPPKTAPSFDDFEAHASTIMMQVVKLMVECGAITLKANDPHTSPATMPAPVKPLDSPSIEEHKEEEIDDEWNTVVNMKPDDLESVKPDDLESLKNQIEEQEWADDDSNRETLASLKEQRASLEAASSHERQAALVLQKAHVSNVRQLVTEIISEVENISTRKFAPFAKLSRGGKIARVAFNKGGEDAIDELCLSLEKMV
jgi:hypothetical protein